MTDLIWAIIPLAGIVIGFIGISGAKKGQILFGFLLLLASAIYFMSL